MNQLFNSSLMSAGNFEDFLHNTVILPAAEPAIIETKPQQELDQKGKISSFSDCIFRSLVSTPLCY